MATTPSTPHTTDPARLEELGKTAAQLSMSSGIGLTEAVVRTVGHVKLNTEQVRRVVEFANHDAFNHKYAQTSGVTRAVHFDEGPADPSTVIQALKTASAPREITSEAPEYDLPPSFLKSSFDLDLEVEPIFRTPAGVKSEVLGLHYKLAAAHEETISCMEVAKVAMQESFAALREHTRFALVRGATADDLYNAWSIQDVKVATEIAPRLGLTLHGIKTAGVEINPLHEVVVTFTKFAEAVHSYSAYDRARASLETEMGRVNTWLGRRAA